MKIATLYTVAAALLMTGCADSAGDYQRAANTHQDAMRVALKEAQPEMMACAKDRELSDIPRSEFLKFTVCSNKVLEAKVLPVSKYPDLMQKFMAEKVENAALYSQGKIEFAQVEARHQMSQLALNDEVTRREQATLSRLQADDNAENESIRRAIATYQQPDTVRTTCYTTGMATNCQSR